MNISVEREASFEVSKHNKFKRNETDDVVYDISSGTLTKTYKSASKTGAMNLSVEREASFEVRKIKTITESPIPTQADPSAPKKNGAKPLGGSNNNNSPSKVMDFVDQIAGAQFYTPTKDSRNLSADSFDPWGDDGIEDEHQESAQKGLAPRVVPALSANNDSINQTPAKVLFPDDQDDSKENSMLVLEETDKAKPFGGVDENGFPTNAPTTSDLYSTSSVAFDALTDDTKNNKEEQPRWRRLLEQIPEGTRVRAMQVRKQIMKCHNPTVVVFDSGIDPSKIGDADKKPSNQNDESVFSYKSFQQFSSSVLSTSQGFLSLPSDASTPVRTQNVRTRTEAKLAEKVTEKALKSIFPQLIPRSDNEQNRDKAPTSKLKLCIDLYEQSAFQTLMADLEGNSQVREVHVFRSWEEGKKDRTRTIEDIRLLFRTIGSLSNLEILNLANFLVEDVQMVSLSQWQNKHLNTIRIHLCKGALSKNLLAVLARLPALRDLTLEMNLSFPFHLLLHSQTLESLTIVANDFQIDNLHVMELVQEIPKNETLKKLTIEPDLQLRTFKLLASSLGKNMGIEEFHFSLLPGNEGDITRVMNELARTLTTNASLRSIRNLNHDKIEVDDDRTCDALMKALSENYIIEDFIVFHEDAWFRERKNRILKENKMEYESMFPQIFQCGNDVSTDEVNTDEVNTTSRTSMVADEDSKTVGAGAGAGLASIGDSVKHQAHRVASGALDYVGQNVGLKK